MSSARVGRISRCEFFRHCKRINRCVELRLGVLLHGHHYGDSLHDITVIIMTFSYTLDFSDICSKHLVASFVYMCGFTMFKVVVLSRVVSFRNGCVSKLVSHGRSVVDLLGTGCCVCDVNRVVPFLLVIPTVVVGGLALLKTFT